MTKNLKFFKGSFVFTLFGIALGAAIGFYYSGTVAGALQTAFICAVLGILEVSLSFDNAVVNAAASEAKRISA